jgi:predicted nuclease of predicted toxin-antitoxin system
MTIWLDEQISPFLCPWIETEFGVPCLSVTSLDVNRGEDLAIFLAARTADAVIMSKDSDFVELVNRLASHHRFFGLPAEIDQTHR